MDVQQDKERKGFFHLGFCLVHVAGRQHLVSPIGHHARGHEYIELVVVDDQHRRRRDRHRAPRRDLIGGQFQLVLGHVERQANDKGCALAQGALDVYDTAVQRDQFLGDGQAQSDPLVRHIDGGISRLLKGLQNPSQIFICNAQSRVGHLKNHAFFLPINAACD